MLFNYCFTYVRIVTLKVMENYNDKDLGGGNYCLFYVIFQYMLGDAEKNLIELHFLESMREISSGYLVFILCPYGV